MAKTINYKERLTEIAGTLLGELSDEEILHLLAERKQLQELEEQYQELQQERAALDQAEEEKVAIEKELARLNKLISPDKPDEELIHLIEERKTWEAKMETIENTLVHLKKGEKLPKEDLQPIDKPEPILEKVPQEVDIAPAKIVSEQKVDIKEIPSINQDFGQEKIIESDSSERSEFSSYLEELRSNTSSMGRILEQLPMDAKKDKPFMLEVAKIDPAYAMHYADKSSLKRDEDFNIKVASIKNKHNSASPLSEMLPEARTANVVMAAIKSDYRNVRFLLPQMEGYDDMLARAKSGALDRMKELKDSADISFLIPKMLQKDKTFMKQIEEIVSKANE